MKRVLYLGLDPKTVDFSDPALPPGLDAAKVQAGIDAAVAQIKDRGWHAVSCMFTPDEAGLAVLKQELAAASYDVVVIGAGVRLPPKNLRLFEAAVNAVHLGAPGVPITFNTRPDDSAEAAGRGLGLA